MTTENRTHETHHLIDRIIVGVDGTDPSIRAADWTADLAHQLRADVVLMEALVRPYSEISPPIDRALQRAERTHVTDEVDGDGSLADAEVEVAEGEPGDTLAFAAADAQLLVIGSKETEGVGRHGFFSLAHALAHHTPCPMLVVPHDAQPLHATPTVLIGVDGSDGNRNAFEWTLRLAEQLGASVTAAFVTDPMYDTFDSAGSYGPEEVAAREEVRGAPDVTFTEAVGADPAKTLQELAADLRADMLIVSARSRRSIDGLLLGKTPDELLHHPTCPTVVVPHGFVAA